MDSLPLPRQNCRWSRVAWFEGASGQPAASGLAVDAAARTGKSKTEAKYEAVSAIQNLLGYLKEHTDGAVPPENLIIFDEAQRAWDDEVGLSLMGRPKSEPELFLDILQRLDWACLVCLVGPGQEINRGEGGLALWGEALSKAAASGHRWRVIAAPQAFEDGPDVSGRGLAGGARPAWDSERAPSPPVKFHAGLPQLAPREVGRGVAQRRNRRRKCNGIAIGVPARLVNPRHQRGQGMAAPASAWRPIRWPPR